LEKAKGKFNMQDKISARHGASRTLSPKSPSPPFAKGDFIGDEIIQKNNWKIKDEKSWCPRAGSCAGNSEDTLLIFDPPGIMIWVSGRGDYEPMLS
jgi:hypothetical protein